MRQVWICIVLVVAANDANATLVVDATETSPGIFQVDVTTDEEFDTIQVEIDGVVANGLNIVPEDATFGKQYFTFTPSFTLLSPLGSPSTNGVFEPGLNATIDLTYGVTSPAAGQWEAGLNDAPFLQFAVLSGVAEVTVNLLRSGPTIATATIPVATAVPEAGAVGCWSLLTACVTLVAARRRIRRAHALGSREPRSVPMIQQVATTGAGRRRQCPFTNDFG